MGFLVSLNYPDLDTRINERAPEDGFSRYERYSEMKAEDIFEEVMAKYKARKPAMGMADASPPVNEMCPIKTNRKANPSITAKNEKGETVAFCCNGCKNKFTAALPASAKKGINGCGQYRTTQRNVSHQARS